MKRSVLRTLPSENLVFTETLTGAFQEPFSEALSFQEPSKNSSKKRVVV